MVRVAFVHPDLGIGGAERLIVDAAVSLKTKDHHVEIYTAHHDPNHCFEQTKDGTLEVTCVGDWLPRSCCNKCYAVFAYLRMLYVAFFLLSRHYFGDRENRFDVFICDQISACIPVLRWTGAKVIFYCHFPDQLLTPHDSCLKKAYRCPIDALEEYTTGRAHRVLVNSKFTSAVFHLAFKSLSRIQPVILYPSINFTSFVHTPEDVSNLFPPSVKCVFLSINRYERKKNLSLAIEAFAEALHELGATERPKLHLIMAGGYDERVIENKEYYLELRQLTESLKVNDNVTFVRSCSEGQKAGLLDCCRALIYTPSNEHFGICPLEAMFARRPVIAVSSGGPLETMVDGKTGFLCEPTAEEFAKKMVFLYQNRGSSMEMGLAGREHIMANFSFRAFTEKLDSVVKGVCES